MRYQVPQFVDIEDKIIGPLTLKQFIYILGGVGLSVVLYFFLPFFISAPLIGLALAFSGSLAFYKINNKPFVEILQAGLKYALTSKLFLWKRVPKKIISSPKEIPQIQKQSLAIPVVRTNNLTNKAFTLSVDDSHIINTPAEKGKIHVSHEK